MLASPIAEGSWRGNIIKIYRVDVCFGASFVFPALSRALPLFFLLSFIFSLALFLASFSVPFIPCFASSRPQLIWLCRSLAVLYFRQQRQLSV